MDHDHALTPPRAARASAAAVLLPVAALVVLALGGPILSGDLWWQLRTGEWILEHGELPTTDPFSHTAGDTHWVLQEYGSQVVYGLVYGALGFAGLRGLGVLLGVLLLWCVQRSASRLLRPLWASTFTAFFALLFALKWELRPHLFSVFFFLRIASLLYDRERSEPPGPRVWVELFALSCVWVQLHAEALFAPFLVLAGLIGALCAALFEQGGARRVRAWAIAFAAALGGTLCSPLFAEPHLYALVGRKVPQQYIEEWFSPFVGPDDPRFAPLTTGVWHTYLLFTVVGGLYVLWLAWQRWSRKSAACAPRWERIGFLAVCIAFALQARRFFWLSWFPGLEAVSAFLLAHPQVHANRVFPALCALGLAFPLWQSHYPRLNWNAARDGQLTEVVDRGLFPASAAEFVAGAGLEGKLYHPYEWGGYLGFTTEQPVFVDGRTVLFEEVIPERWEAERDPARAREVFAAREVRVVIFKSFVNHNGQGWRPWSPPGGRQAWVRVWSDRLARVWVRRGDRDNLERARRWLGERGIDFDAEQGFLEAAALAARPEWLDEKRLLDAELSELVRAQLEPGRELVRAEIYLRSNMRRNARHELLRWAQSNGPTHAPGVDWARLWDELPPDEVLRRAQQAHPPLEGMSWGTPD